MTQLNRPRAKYDRRSLTRDVTCPICSKQIPFWRIVTAPWLPRVRCHHCRAKLRFERVRWPIYALCLILGAATALPLGLLWSSGRLSTAAAATIFVAMLLATVFVCGLIAVRWDEPSPI